MSEMDEWNNEYDDSAEPATSKTFAANQSKPLTREDMLESGRKGVNMEVAKILAGLTITDPQVTFGENTTQISFKAPAQSDDLEKILRQKFRIFDGAHLESGIRINVSPSQTTDASDVNVTIPLGPYQLNDTIQSISREEGRGRQRWQ